MRIRWKYFLENFGKILRNFCIDQSKPIFNIFNFCSEFFRKIKNCVPTILRNFCIDQSKPIFNISNFCSEFFGKVKNCVPKIRKYLRKFWSFKYFWTCNFGFLISNREKKWANAQLRLLKTLKLCTFLQKYLLVPWVLFTKVLPTWRSANMHGALTSYQSLRVKGSILK